MQTSDTPEMTPSQRTVYDYLATGRTLTQLIAIANLSTGSLTSRVAELRALGHDIKSEWRKDHAGARYKAYWMEKGPEGR